MPYRRLPNTDQARVRALKAAVEKGDLYSVRDLAISLKTLFEARNFLQRFEAAQIYYTQCYDNQAKASRKHQANVKTARLYISHFIQVLNLAVLRDEIKTSHKNMYGLPEANVVPDLLSEAALVEWGKKIIEGTRQTRPAPYRLPDIRRTRQHGRRNDLLLYGTSGQNKLDREIFQGKERKGRQNGELPARERSTYGIFRLPSGYR